MKTTEIQSINNFMFSCIPISKHNFLMYIEKSGKASKREYAYPGTKGYFEEPQSFFKWWRSEWHIPVYNTLNLTSFSPVALNQNQEFLSLHVIQEIQEKETPKVSQIEWKSTKFNKSLAYMKLRVKKMAPSWEVEGRKMPRWIASCPSKCLHRVLLFEWFCHFWFFSNHKN